MSRFVPYLADESIERNAASLIAEFEHARGVTIVPPIPVEDIVEKHLKIRIEFDDLRVDQSSPRDTNVQAEILGAATDDGRILIDESLDPDESPRLEGRYRFTLAHELGHHRLHQHLLGKVGYDIPPNEHKILERQAHAFAAYITMPKAMVLDLWVARFPSGRPWVYRWFYDEIEESDSHHRNSTSRLTLEEEEEMDSYFMEICRPFCALFGMSNEATRIRLERLGLLVPKGSMRALHRAA